MQSENMYNLELERVCSEIHKLNAKRVMLQLPDGMRPFALKIVNSIQEKTPSKVILSGDSCYGACDLALKQARNVKADLLIHYGHSSMIKSTSIPILYIHGSVDIDVGILIAEARPLLLNWENVGVVTTIQHIHQITDIIEELKSMNIKPHLGKISESTPLGQVLGCNYEAAYHIQENVHGFLYIGGGQFHPKGLFLTTGKPVVIADPYSYKVTLVSEQDLMNYAKKRVAMISLTKKKKVIGIIVSSKSGQQNLKAAEDLHISFQERGYQSTIIYLDEVRSEHLNNFTEIEAFVNTACPRIALDGINGILKPIISVKEAYVVLEKRKWEDIWGNKYL
jgi:2-(3-amino-3-carboxypropyl)histidine synthase